MSSVRATMTGAGDLSKKLAKLAGTAVAQREMKLALLAGAKPIASRAAELSPVLTGRLKRSIEIREIDADVQVRAAAPYAHLVEFGHRGGAKGRPFMRPAYHETKDQAIKIVQNHMAAAIAKEAK